MWQFTSPDCPIEVFITMHDKCPLELAYYVIDAVSKYYDDINSVSEVVPDDVQEVC